MHKHSSTTGMSRQQILGWVHSILPDHPPLTRIEELGKGVVYCRIISHYFPGVVPLNRLLPQPKSEY